MKSIKEKLKEALNSDYTDYEVVRWIKQNFPELAESEDERIGKELIEFVKSRGGFKQEYIAWIEEQANHANFRNGIKIGDKVTRNENGVLVNLSQLKRVAKKDEQILANSAKTYKDKQKFAWSEKDEAMTEIIINDIVAIKERTCCKNVCDEEINLLESLKDRVQPKQEWSEEDERMLNDIIRCGEHHCYLDAGNIAWLKSIAPPYYCDNCKLKKYTQGWKPSDEQMEQLHKYCPDNRHLTSLYEQLKKLKEE